MTKLREVLPLSMILVLQLLERVFAYITGSLDFPNVIKQFATPSHAL